MRKKVVEWAVSIVGVGGFLLTWANWIANHLGFLSLPDDIRWALLEMSQIPTFFAILLLIIGLAGLGFLFREYGFIAACLTRTRRLNLRLPKSLITIPQNIVTSPAEPLSAEDIRFRQDLRKFVVSNVAEINQSFGYLVGGLVADLSSNIANNKVQGPELERMEAIVSLFDEVMRLSFYPRYGPLLETADKPTNTMNVADIASKLTSYFDGYRDAQINFRSFLQLSGADPNKDDLLTHWLASDSRALGALHDLKSFPQG